MREIGAQFDHSLERVYGESVPLQSGNSLTHPCALLQGLGGGTHFNTIL